MFAADEARRVRFEVDARLRWIEFRPVVRETTRAIVHLYARRSTRTGWPKLSETVDSTT